jgi:hypothetical protein
MLARALWGVAAVASVLFVAVHLTGDAGSDSGTTPVLVVKQLTPIGEPANVAPLDVGVVPLVVGLRGSLAVQVARNAGLKVELKERPDENTRFGFVAAQSPREGARLSKGDTLTIWVARGP